MPRNISRKIIRAVYYDEARRFAVGWHRANVTRLFVCYHTRIFGSNAHHSLLRSQTTWWDANDIPTLSKPHPKELSKSILQPLWALERKYYSQSQRTPQNHHPLRLSHSSRDRCRFCIGRLSLPSMEQVTQSEDPTASIHTIELKNISVSKTAQYHSSKGFSHSD